MARILAVEKEHQHARFRVGFLHLLGASPPGGFTLGLGFLLGGIISAVASVLKGVHIPKRATFWRARAW
jgi:hypothetical protein